MSLDFDFTAMIERLGQEEYDRITDHPLGEKTWHPVTNGIIWGSMYVGVPGLTTDADVNKFAERLLALQALNGGDILTARGRVVITQADIEAHRGLRTNVSRETDAQFAKKLYRIAKENGRCVERKQEKSGFDKLAEIIAEVQAAENS